MSTTIRVRCTDQALTYENTPVIASGGLEVDSVHFEFCTKWDGFVRTAVFWRSPAEVYHVLLDDTDTCKIPREVLQQDGLLHFGVFGVHADGRQRPAEALTYRVVKGAITEGTKPTDPTPEIYTQLLAEYAEMQAALDKAVEDVEAAGIAAEANADLAHFHMKKAESYATSASSDAVAAGNKAGEAYASANSAASSASAAKASETAAAEYAEQAKTAAGGGVSSWNDLQDIPDTLAYIEEGDELVEILPDYTITEENMDADMAGIPRLGLVAGNTYTVTLQGTEYTCVAWEVTEGGMTAVGLGDIYTAMEGQVGSAPTGEPFLLMEYPPEIAAEQGVNVVAQPLVEMEFPIVFSITGKAVTVHKLDNRCLDLDWLPTANYQTVVPMGEYDNGTQVNSAIVPAVGGNAKVVYDGEPYNLTICDLGANGLSYVGNGYLVLETVANTGEPFVVVGAQGVLQIKFADENSHSFGAEIANIDKIPEYFLPEIEVPNGNIMNGSADGSVRTVYALSENSGYTMGDYSFACGRITEASGYAAHAEGDNTTASGRGSHAEGGGAKASGLSSHAEGSRTEASGEYSHAEGSGTKATGHYSHAEGVGTEASKNYSHAEGYRTTASGESSHAEGYSTTASGESSHAEGNGATASGDFSHAEGYYATASGDYSHAEGHHATASGDFSHVEGAHTIASGTHQHVQGAYNIEDAAGKYLHIVGNGTADTGRKNAHTLDWSGNAWFAGGVSCEGGMESKGIITCHQIRLSSSTPGSTKTFIVFVDDTGTLSAYEEQV